MKNIFCIVMITAIVLGSGMANASQSSAFQAELTCPYINVPCNDHEKTQNG